MKKLALVAAILSALGAGWAGSTWYVGEQTQQQLKSQLEQTNQLLAQTPQLEGMKAELVEYNKHFMDATGKIKISLPKSLGEGAPEFLNVLMNIKHGPVVVNEGSPHLAMSLIESRFDQSSLETDVQKKIKSLFNDKEPLLIKTQLGFNNNADYTMKLNPINFEDEAKTGSVNFEGINLSGSTLLGTQNDRKTYEGPLEGKIGKMEVKLGEDVLVLLPESTVKGSAKGFMDGELVNSTMDINMPGISVKTKDLPEPVSFGLNIKSNADTTETDTNGGFNLTVSDLMTPILPTSKASYDIKFNGLNTVGLKEVREILNQLEPVQNELRLLDEMNAANQVGVNSDEVLPESSGDTAASSTPTPDSEADSTTSTTPQTPSTDNASETDTTEGVAEGDAVASVPEDQAPPETSPMEENVIVEESPEAQAKRAELEKKRAELGEKALEVVISKVLQANKSQLKNDISLENKLGGAKLNVDLAYVGTKDGKPLTQDVLKELQPEQGLALVKGNINFSFDRDLFPMAALFLNSQPFIVKDNSKYKMSLQLAGDKLVLNDKPMTLDEFSALLKPQAKALEGLESTTEAGTASEPASTDSGTTEDENIDVPSPDEGMDGEGADSTKPATDTAPKPEDNKPTDKPATNEPDAKKDSAKPAQ